MLQWELDTTLRIKDKRCFLHQTKKLDSSTEITQSLLKTENGEDHCSPIYHSIIAQNGDEGTTTCQQSITRSLLRTEIWGPPPVRNLSLNHCSEQRWGDHHLSAIYHSIIAQNRDEGTTTCQQSITQSLLRVVVTTSLSEETVPGNKDSHRHHKHGNNPIFDYLLQWWIKFKLV